VLGTCEGLLQIGLSEEKPCNVLGLSKQVASYIYEGTVTLRVELNAKKEITKIICRGEPWHSILQGCAVLAQRKPLQLADVEEVMECFPSLEDSL
jgi:hypothetical protein